MHYFQKTKKKRKKKVRISTLAFRNNDGFYQSFIQKYQNSQKLKAKTFVKSKIIEERQLSPIWQ